MMALALLSEPIVSRYKALTRVVQVLKVSAELPACRKKAG